MGGSSSSSSGRRSSRIRGRGVSAEINVTPLVDVMLVLLIVFMISAPLLTVGVPLDLPQSQAKSLDQDREPLTLSVNDKGQVFLQNTEIKIEELVEKLKAVAKAGVEERIYVRGDKKVDYGTVMRVMGRLVCRRLPQSRARHRSRGDLDSRPCAYAPEPPSQLPCMESWSPGLCLILPR